MAPFATYTLVGASLVVAVWAGLMAARNRPVDNPLFYGVLIVEVGLVAQLVGGTIALVRTDRALDSATFVAYLVTVVLVPPAAVLWGIAEKSRWGVGVVAFGMLTVAALCLRILDVWSGHYA